MTLTKSDVDTLDRAEEFINNFNKRSVDYINYFNQQSPDSSLRVQEKDEAELDMILLANGLFPKMNSLSLIFSHFKDTAEEKRFVKVVNELTEGSYRAGRPNNIKENSATIRMNEIFPDIKISGKDLELEEKYPDHDWPPPAWDFK